LLEALYSDLYRDATRPINSARFLFLDPRARTFFADWDTTVRDVVAALRGEADRNPNDRDLSNLIGVPSTRSEEFRFYWARHDVRFHRSGTKRFRHPLVGELTLAYEGLALPADPGPAIVTYSAEPRFSIRGCPPGTPQVGGDTCRAHGRAIDCHAGGTTNSRLHTVELEPGVQDLGAAGR
jgi:hypothetical protein